MTVVLGIGMSSKATAAEVRTLIHDALRSRDLRFDDIEIVATRERFVLDDRLAIGRRVVGIDDAQLEVSSLPCERTIGIKARVAETAAQLASSAAAQLVGPVERSAHVTVAVFADGSLA